MRFSFALSIFFLSSANSFIVESFSHGFSTLNPSSATDKVSPSQLQVADPSVIQELAASSLETVFEIDPLMESEILGTSAHIILDLTTFVLPATPFFVQFLTVIGRVLCIAADYVPDHSMLPEEFVYQLTLLGISVSALFKSVTSILKAHNLELSRRDHKCFEKFFELAGVSWLQYKMLMASAVEWEDLKSGNIVMSDESYDDDELYNKEKFLYLLYEGELEISSKGNVLQIISPKKGHLIGDIDHAISGPVKKSHHHDSDSLTNDSSTNPKTTIKVASKKAKIQRINISKMKELMAQDESLDIAMQNMLFLSMQARIQDLMYMARVMAIRKEKMHRQCFDRIFRSEGLQWKHYKKLMASKAIGWEEVPAGSVLVSSCTTESCSLDDLPDIEQGDYLYFLYRGEVKFFNQYGRVLRKMKPATGHLFGDLHLPVVPASLQETYDAHYDNTSIRVGTQDSVILSVDSRKMKQLMDEDKSFKLAIQQMMYLQECTIQAFLASNRLVESSNAAKSYSSSVA